jgi:SAM-dependent methyltransferase
MASDHSVARLADLARVWARLYRRGSLSLLQIPAAVRNDADLGRISLLREETRDTFRNDPTSAAKYTDYRFWIPFNVDRVANLSLHAAKPLRVLDIGCGPGYFLAAARACGHTVYGVDAPASVMSPVEKRVYGELLAALSLTPRVSTLLVERFVPMALGVRDLDLITAFWICFNCHRRDDEWGAREWSFFIQDALSYLRDGGILHLELNSNPERYKALQWYDDETLALFRSAGDVNRNVVRIRK